MCIQGKQSTCIQDVYLWTTKETVHMFPLWILWDTDYMFICVFPVAIVTPLQFMYPNDTVRVTCLVFLWDPQRKHVNCFLCGSQVPWPVTYRARHRTGPNAIFSTTTPHTTSIPFASSSWPSGLLFCTLSSSNTPRIVFLGGDLCQIWEIFDLQLEVFLHAAGWGVAMGSKLSFVRLTLSYSLCLSPHCAGKLWARKLYARLNILRPPNTILAHVRNIAPSCL